MRQRHTVQVSSLSLEVSVYVRVCVCVCVCVWARDRERERRGKVGVHEKERVPVKNVRFPSESVHLCLLNLPSFAPVVASFLYPCVWVCVCVCKRVRVCLPLQSDPELIPCGSHHHSEALSLGHNAWEKKKKKTGLGAHQFHRLKPNDGRCVRRRGCVCVLSSDAFS